MEEPRAALGVGASQNLKPSTVLIVNTLSRRGADLFRRAHRVLKRLGVDLSASYPIRSQQDLLRAVRAAVEDEHTTRIVVGGGDGTISTVADAIAYREIVLGVLPLGTGNDFTRLMGISGELEGACEVVRDGDVRTINLARVNRRYFLGMALIGFPAHINHAVPNWLKKALGKFAYAIAATAALLDPRPFRAVITVDGARHELETSVVAIGNGRFYVPARSMPADERPDFDRLVVQAPRDGRASTLFRLAFQFARHGRMSPDLMHTWSGHDVTVDTKVPQEIDADGEFIDWTPARATFERSALRVVLPAASAQPVNGQG